MILGGIAFSGIIIAFMCIALLFSKKKNVSSDYYLMVWLLACTANLVYYLFPSLLPELLQSFGFALPILSMGMLYLYVISITFNIPFRSYYLIRHSLFFLGYSLFFIGVSIFYSRIGFKNSIPYFTEKNQSGLLNLITFPMAVVPVVYIVLCFLALKKYQKMLPEYYSALEKINLNWLKYIIVSLIVLFTGVSCMIALGTRTDIIPFERIFQIVAAVQSGYLFCIVFFSLRQSIVFHQQGTLTTEIPMKQEVRSDVMNKNSSDGISQKLLEFMETAKPYLDEELSLQKLSLLMDISTHQLSHTINQGLNTNFYKFVNAYRIEEVRKKLKDPEFEKYSILGIAFESGFNSKSTFNKIFKEETGMTPSEFKKSESAGKES
ncbi:helix-turn-helix domain-containing protein [Chryseobacterium indologenes]|uniref:helix-turn-helix domain-containing protein n=1 Tax=Chryseobacterium indologenes TaxID=253 RepID=UPI0023E8374E|nr:helix-turn-helix domain-containing protein [Chryseobacterium indologenes]WET50484.1 helix-turn-helix domain-containing protein [Chryseobacterium indologenes]